MHLLCSLFLLPIEWFLFFSDFRWISIVIYHTNIDLLIQLSIFENNLKMTEWTKEEMDQEILECARYGEDEDLNVFLSAGADVNFVDSNGNTAMHKAAANGNVNCMKVLKSFGANYVVNNEGNFPAHWAAQNGKLAALQFLVDNYDVDMLAKNSVGRSILTEAFASKDEQSIELCLSHPSANE